MAVITVADTRITLLADFHPELSTQAYRYRGRWAGKDVGWAFRREHEDGVRALCRTLYGVDGTPEAWADQCDVRVSVAETSIAAPLWRQFNADIYVGGRHIAGALKNRPIARTGKGVKFLQGAPLYLRERLAYTMLVADGAILEIRNYPRAALAFLSRDLDGHGTWELATP